MFKLEKAEKFLLLFLFIFSCALMWKTFGVTGEGNLQIASKAWSDFAATIPLIRSFSFGHNFPPQYPIFAGPPIRYHFVFFAVVGLLEKMGIRIDYSFNSLSIVFFFLLLVAIYYIGKIIFQSKTVGVISVILFLFNGSFGFLEFFKKYPLSLNTLSDILKNTSFSSFGPYDDKVVSAFWSLNIYTNQRHLALAYATYLFFLLYIFLSNRFPEKLTVKKSMIIGLILGIFPFIHLSIFLMSGISLIIFLLTYPKLRKQVFIIGATALYLAIPQYLYMGSPDIKTSLFHPGYLVSPLTFNHFIKYWFLNLGLTTILAPIGFSLADKEQRKILIPFLSFFAIGNLFQFAPDMPTNHKFFNLFLICLNFFTAYFLTKLFQKKFLGKLVSIILIFFLTITGFVDIFPIFNDTYIIQEDVPNNKAGTFIVNNTPPNTVFLNSQFLYDPASLAGRKIYMGWPYFSWGAGYDTSKRDRIMKNMLMPNNLTKACQLYLSENIGYIETQIPNSYIDTPVDYSFFEKNFNKIYYDKEKNYSIYEINPVCTKLF